MLKFIIPSLSALAVLISLNIQHGVEAGRMNKRVARMHYSNVYPYDAVPDPWDNGGGFLPYPGPFPPPFYPPYQPSPAPAPPPPPNVVYIPGPDRFHHIQPEYEVVHGDPIHTYEPAPPPKIVYVPASSPPQINYI